MAERDPLSVRYDGTVRALMIRAARAERDRKSIQAWIASPRGEFRHRDKGGRTAHERAFMRSAYYLIFRTPIREGRAPDWSLKLTWGSDADRRASSQGRMARPAPPMSTAANRWSSTPSSSTATVVLVSGRSSR